MHLQAQHSDANIFGDVQSEGEHIAFATVHIEGTSIGTATDICGHYMLIDLEPGTHMLVASSIGYTTIKKEITIKEDEVLEVNFELEAESMAIDEVVITGTKTFKRQRLGNQKGLNASGRGESRQAQAGRKGNSEPTCILTV